MVEIIGLLVFILDVIFGLYWSIKGKTRQKEVRYMCFLVGMLAIILIVFNRFNRAEIETPLGTLKGTMEKARTYVKQIEEIKERVEAQSATVDLIAKQAAEAKKISEDLVLKNKEAGKELSAIEKILREASKTSKELQLLSVFTMTVISAQNDSRKALDQLKKWSGDKTFPLFLYAKKAQDKIIDQHAPLIYGSNFKIPWNEGVDPAKYDFLALQNKYKTTPDYYKPAILEYIWKRNDVYKRDKMQFFIEIMQNEESLTAVEYAGRYFSEGANLKIKPLAIEYFIEWWDKNKDKVN